MRFACPDDRAPLDDLAGPCPACGRAFVGARLPTFVGRGDFELRDLRPAGSEPLGPDEIRGHHDAIVARSLAERDRFAQVGFGGLPDDLSALRRPSAGPPPYGEAARSAMRELTAAVGRVLHPGRNRPGDRASAEAWYGADRQMASDLTRGRGPFMVDGRMVLTSKLEHHLRNMDALSEVVAGWGATSLLEAGVGTGANLLLLRGLLGDGVALSGLDRAVPRVLSARATDQVFGLGVEDLLLADALAIPVRDGAVDVVFSQYVLTYLRGREDRVLDEMLRVARLGVVFFETAAVRTSPLERAYLARTGQSRRLARLVRGRRDVEVEALVKRGGDRHVGIPTIMAVLRKR